MARARLPGEGFVYLALGALVALYALSAAVPILRREALAERGGAAPPAPAPGGKAGAAGGSRKDASAPRIVAGDSPSDELARIVGRAVSEDGTLRERDALVPVCMQKLDTYMAQVTGVAEARGVGLVDLPAKEGKRSSSTAVTVQLSVQELLAKAWAWVVENRDVKTECDAACADAFRAGAAQSYEVGEEEWAAEAEATVRGLSPSVVESGSMAGQWRAFSALVKSGQHQKAALEASTFYTGQEPAGGFREPQNAVRIMYNARFWFFGAAHDCHTLVSSGCWGRLRAYHFEADAQECLAPDSKQPRYSKVALVSSRKSLPYYHFLMEVLPRVALVLPLIRSDPSVQIAVDTSVTKGALPRWVTSHFAILGIPTSRLIPYSKHDGGCADVLIYPEPASCLGPTFAQLHVLRTSLLSGLVRLGTAVDSQAFQPRHGSDGAGGPRQSWPYVLLVNRLPMVKRHVTNFDELRAELVRVLGGETDVRVHTGTEGMLEQLKMFAGASGVVAPHGAALSNIVVMRKHSAVLEYLSEGSDIVLVYMMLSLRLQLRYQGIVTPGNTHRGVWHVDAKEGAAAMLGMLRAG